MRQDKQNTKVTGKKGEETELAVNCCEYRKEISDSVNDLEIIDRVNECQLLKKNSAFWT